jgi:hypothetical protein
MAQMRKSGPAKPAYKAGKPAARKKAGLAQGALVGLSLLPAGRAVRGIATAAKAASTAKKTTATARAAQGAKITAQQKATVASKTKVSSLEKQIKEIEAQMKSNAARAKEIANSKRAPGAPARDLYLLDANKKLAADLKKIRQAYSDAKSNW